MPGRIYCESCGNPTTAKVLRKNGGFCAACQALRVFGCPKCYGLKFREEMGESGICIECEESAGETKPNN